MKKILGNDIAKATFDVSLIVDEDTRVRGHFQNNSKGFKALSKWLSKQGVSKVHACMEATSIYWEALALYLHEAGHEVSVVNPARIKGYAQSQLRRSKTDALDADIIADFCRTQEPTLWQPPTPQQRKLRALVRHLETLKKSRTQQLNRLAVCTDEEVRTSLELILKTLKEEITRLEQRIKEFIDDDPDLQERYELLCSIKSIGPKSATHILAEMYDLEYYKNAKAAAADAGVTASHHTSGETIRRRSKMSRLGKATIRGALYLPAINAMKYNPAVRRLVERLRAKGKPTPVIIVAAMRKLLHIAYGVLKHRQPFDPNYELASA